MDEARCPKCGSTNWRCWDERIHRFYDPNTDEEFDWPIGYLKCRDCGRAYTDGWPDDSSVVDVTDEWNNG